MLCICFVFVEHDMLCQLIKNERIIFIENDFLNKFKGISGPFYTDGNHPSKKIEKVEKYNNQLAGNYKTNKFTSFHFSQNSIFQELQEKFSCLIQSRVDFQVGWLGLATKISQV
jgi:hypothetical protein